MIKTSEQISELFKAMAEFQKEVNQPKKDADNPFFKSKYVPLENVVDAIHKVGSKNGLSEITYPVQEGGQVGVGVIITHSSGQYIELPPVLLKPDKNTPQGVGAALTYARRYALSSAFGIASETDDDGNSISGNANDQQVKRKQQSAKKRTKAQRDELHGLLTEYMTVKGVDGEKAFADMMTWLMKQVKAKRLAEATHGQTEEAIGIIKSMVQKEQAKKSDD